MRALWPVIAGIALGITLYIVFCVSVYAALAISLFCLLAAGPVSSAR